MPVLVLISCSVSLSEKSAIFVVILFAVNKIIPETKIVIYPVFRKLVSLKHIPGRTPVLCGCLEPAGFRRA